MDDVFAQGVVLSLDRFVVIFEGVQFADLLLELLNVAFFALAEGALLYTPCLVSDLID